MKNTCKPMNMKNDTILNDIEYNIAKSVIRGLMFEDVAEKILYEENCRTLDTIIQIYLL